MNSYPMSGKWTIHLNLMRRVLMLVVVLSFLNGALFAQSSTMSLQQSIDYALKNSPSMKGTLYDVQIAQLETEKLLGIGLPQLSGSLQYQNYIDLPTSIVPGDFFGAPGQEIRLQFGTPHNMTAGLSASQLLFNGSWLVGLQASKAYAELQNKNVKLSELELKQKVAEAYSLCVIAERNVEILSNTKAVLTQLRDETAALLQAGFVEQQDVDQLSLNVNDMDNRISAAQEQQKLTNNLLKFTIGMPLTEELVLSQKATDLMGGTALDGTGFSADANINVQLAENALVMRELALKNEKAKLLPNAAAFYNLQTQALRQEFNFFDTSKPWFPIQLWGVQMNIPIFTGGSQNRAIQIAKVELEKSKVTVQMAKEGAYLEYQSAKINYDFALKNLTTTEQSLQLAQSILDKTNIKFKEGLSSSFDVSQSTAQVLQAQGNYVQAMLSLLNAEVALKKALNNL